MNSYLTITSVELAVFAGLSVIGIALCRGKVQWHWLGWAVALFLARSIAITSGFGQLPLPDVVASGWAWEYKAFSILVVGGLMAYALKGQWAEAGVTLRQNPDTRIRTIIAGLVIVGYSTWVATWNGGTGVTGNVDTFAFQATMPGLDEELFFRGGLLLMLDRAFGAPLNLLKARVGWGAFMSIVLFGLGHSLFMSEGTVQFVFAAWTYPALWAVFLTYTRAASGSLLIPVIIHNAGNVIGYLI